MADDPWYEPDEDGDDEQDGFLEYDLTASPNDFNVLTIANFVQSGAVIIPPFQRNYVWDLKRASKLIESIIMGLPVPQIFLYEKARNKFLVIDGQQRLMSISYFVRKRFPRKEKRVELRGIVTERGELPEEVIEDDEFFERFNLRLPSPDSQRKNPLNGLNYDTLGEYRQLFDLRPIRNIIVKQLKPEQDDSAVYEIFHRLNSGGMLLAPQEVRASLYHSDFYQMLARLNAEPRWRRFIGVPDPDLNLKDLEFLLRGFAMAINGVSYNAPMSRFLNDFSRRARSYEQSYVGRLERAFRTFMDACNNLEERAFRTLTNRFSVTIYESVFAAVMASFIATEHTVQPLTDSFINELKANSEFTKATMEGSTKSSSVQTRLGKAREILSRNVESC